MPRPLVPTTPPPPGPIPNVYPSSSSREPSLSHLLETLVLEDSGYEGSDTIIRCLNTLTNVLQERVNELEDEKQEMSNYMELLKRQNNDLNEFLKRAIRLCRRQEEQITIFRMLLNKEDEHKDLVELTYE